MANRYTHRVSPRGSQPIEITVIAGSFSESQEETRAIVRDVWAPAFEKDPDHEIVGRVIKVEQMKDGITLPPGSLAGALG